MSEDEKIVATGTWYYDGNVPRRIAVCAKEARFASSRYDWEKHDGPALDETRPIPETRDGFLYYCFLGNSGEYLSIEDAKTWADAQSWGPVAWDSSVADDVQLATMFKLPP
jgi:hypothetical protein